MKTTWALVLVATSLLFAGPAGAASADMRFSHTLSASDKTESGIESLTSDQVAVLDALVRRDTAGRAKALSTRPETSTNESPTTFSQRLTDDERRIAGITTLGAAEVQKVDALVQQFHAAKHARALLAPPSFISRHARAAQDADPERKLHGSFSLSYGWGKGGYSEKTGSMDVYYNDPAGRYSIGIGYSESHIEGGNGYIYRDPLYRDPFYRDPFYRDPLDPHYRDPFHRDAIDGHPRALSPYRAPFLR